MLHVDWFLVGVALGMSFLMLGVALLLKWKEGWGQINFPLMFAASAMIGLGYFSALFGVSVLSVAVPRLEDPAFMLGALLSAGGFLFLYLFGASTLLTSMNKNLGVPPWYPLAGVISTCLVISILTAFPWLKIPVGSLVAREGVVLPYGSSYALRPGLKADVVGLANPVIASFRMPYGNNKIVLLSADVRLKVEPGDRIPENFKWYDFRKALNAWFAERLDSRYDFRPRFKSTHLWGAEVFVWNDNHRSTGKAESDSVMGLPVVWDGSYRFRFVP